MKYEATSSQLSEALSLRVRPIAVSLGSELPEGARLFSGAVAAGCMFWEQAEKEVIATEPHHHESCSIGVYTHNLPSTSASYGSELTTVLQVLGSLSYVRPEDIPQIPVLKTSPKFVTYGPLAKSSAAPDVVLMFAQAAQSLVISEAVQQVENGVPPAMGRPACAVIPQVVNSGKAALSLGCCGARAYLSILTDDVAMWALPGFRIEEFTERIVALSAANRLLDKFHKLRAEDVAAGLSPTYQESMARLQG